eukprot:TRINITY_DN3464_c0_g1_i1.p1 TRINITY_DN3464_c0_g1~~TRINITY_DN3464_c0_g1_i1.p1  ORF type:complete len:453 (+),score=32.00 TRINITY_DN3464_c0_g1_i1:123-1481(+)
MTARHFQRLLLLFLVATCLYRLPTTVACNIYKDMDGLLRFTCNVTFVGPVTIDSNADNQLPDLPSGIQRNDTHLSIVAPRGFKVDGALTVVNNRTLCKSDKPVITGFNKAIILCAGVDGGIAFKGVVSSNQERVLDPSWYDCSIHETFQAQQRRLVRIGSSTSSMLSSHAYMATMVNGNILYHGGREQTGSYQSATLRSVNYGFTWTTIDTGLPALGDAAMCHGFGYTYLFGGSTCSGRGIVNNIRISSDGGNTWSPGGTLPSRTGFTHCTVLNDNQVLLHEGCTSYGAMCWSSCSYQHGIYRYTRSTQRVETLDGRPTRSGTMHQGRAYVMLSGNATRAILSGGHGSNGWKQLGDAWISTDQGGAWTQLPVPWPVIDSEMRVFDWHGHYFAFGTRGPYIRAGDGDGQWFPLNDDDNPRIWGGNGDVLLFPDNRRVLAIKGQTIVRFKLQCK